MTTDCPIATSERLRALLAGELGASEQRVLSAHLETPCERCLELLEGMEPGAWLEVVGGAGAELSRAEANRIFTAARPAEDQTGDASPSLWEKIGSWLRPPLLVPAAAAALALIIAVPVLLVDKPEPYDGVKGGPATRPTLKIELIGVVAKRVDGKPTALRRARESESVSAQELLLFRYRLNASAHIYLLASGDASVEVLFAGHEEAAAGERELSAQGQVLALDPSTLGDHVTLVLVASPTPVAGLEQIENLTEILDDTRRASLCPDCALDQLEVRTAAAR